MSSSLIPRRDDFLFPIEQAFDRFFSDFFRNDPMASIRNSGGYPKMDVYEHNGEFIVSVCATGMTTENIEVDVTPENILVIRGRMHQDHRTPEGSTVYLRELRSSAFERQLQLPDHVKGDPHAVLKDGVLTLTWEAQTKPQPPPVRRIAIKNE